MSHAPLPQPSNPTRIEAYVDIFATVFQKKPAAYVSAPITSGRRFLDWFRQRGTQLDPHSREYQDELVRAVIKPNCDEINARVEDLDFFADRILINPAAFNRPEWTQDDYRYFWGRVIERFADTVIFLKGWQYSSGCGYEFLRCSQNGLRAFKEDESALPRDEGCRLIEAAVIEIREVGASTLFLERILNDLQKDASRLNGDRITARRRTPAVIQPITEIVDRQHFKDIVLDQLATVANIAQFVSFGPERELPQRFLRINGVRPNHHYNTPEEAIAVLLAASPEGTVNVRGFWPDRTTGEPLVYGLSEVASVLETLREKASRHLYTIVNETIDTNDGGVSGVALGDFLEFAPQETPKCVEKPGICLLPRNIGLRLLQQTYGFRPALAYDQHSRVEFSLHPKRRGLCAEHTIIWEIENVQAAPISPIIQWPHKFSRFLGDKAFGLLLADALGLPVPRTMVVSRNVAPFMFGQETGTSEIWMRTCPEVRSPGKYETTYGWTDPFEILARHNHTRSPGDVRISAVLAQEAVHPIFSGSLMPRPILAPLVEGVEGRGDAFMVGKVPPAALPNEVRRAVLELYSAAERQLGPVELEWVFDGTRAWIVQIHAASVILTKDAIFPGDAAAFERFDVELGLEALRALIPKLISQRLGLVLVGNVGITSHFGDLLRNARIPSRIERHSAAT